MAASIGKNLLASGSTALRLMKHALVLRHQRPSALHVRQDIQALVVERHGNLTLAHLRRRGSFRQCRVSRPHAGESLSEPKRNIVVLTRLLRDPFKTL